MEVTETSTLERDRLRAGRDAGLRLKRPLAELRRHDAAVCVGGKFRVRGGLAEGRKLTT